MRDSMHERRRAGDRRGRVHRQSLIAELARLNKNSEIVALDMREVPDERLSMSPI